MPPLCLQDTKKFERARELLQKDKEIKAAKKVSTGHSSMLDTNTELDAVGISVAAAIGGDPLGKPRKPQGELVVQPLCQRCLLHSASVRVPRVLQWRQD